MQNCYKKFQRIFIEVKEIWTFYLKWKNFHRYWIIICKKTNKFFVKSNFLFLQNMHGKFFSYIFYSIFEHKKTLSKRWRNILWSSHYLASNLQLFSIFEYFLKGILNFWQPSVNYYLLYYQACLMDIILTLGHLLVLECRVISPFHRMWGKGECQ